ncbi:MAG TPA: archease [Streptosporangiaceae bacterium]|nr:archease [Streptosporangiaceae bacterium]
MPAPGEPSDAGEGREAGKAERGHRGLPHTADIRIEAWGPTREACLEEAVAALVDAFAGTSGMRAERSAEAELAADTDEDALVAVLDEVIYLADTEEVIPLSAEVTCRTGGLRLRMDVAPLHDAEITGAVPKAVTLHGLRFSRAAGRWSCTATIDV